MTEILANLKKGQSLSFDESKSLFLDLMEGKYEESVIIEILEAFIKKGETKPMPNELHISNNSWNNKLTKAEKEAKKGTKNDE